MHVDRTRNADQRNRDHHRLRPAALVLFEMVSAQTNAHRSGQVRHVAAEKSRSAHGQPFHVVERISAGH